MLTATFLRKAKAIDWFANSGTPNESYHMVFSVFEAYDTWNGQMLETWEPQVTALENMAKEKLGDAAIDSIFERVSAAIGDTLWEKWAQFIDRQKLDGETGLDNEMLDMVKRDVAWACVENKLRVKGFFTMLLEIYKEGYFPCAWLGDYPEGKPVVL
ncbi:MAG: hypothetical protein E7559_07795 [Ruminococcaceae bacterium]|nr:hypothetical protein [Oscillospiraceae bacterium]